MGSHPIVTKTDIGRNNAIDLLQAWNRSRPLCEDANGTVPGDDTYIVITKQVRGDTGVTPVGNLMFHEAVESLDQQICKRIGKCRVRRVVKEIMVKGDESGTKAIVREEPVGHNR